MQTQNFVVTDLDLGSELLGELLLLLKLQLESREHLVVLFYSLVSFTDLKSPLVLIYEHSVLHLKARVDSVDGWWATHAIELLVHAFAIVAGLLDSVSHFHALLIALKHIVLLFVELTQTFHDLILAWIIDLFQSLLHLGLELDIFRINFLDSLVLGVNQELQILAFLL
jgi:hypothetical protein